MAIEKEVVVNKLKTEGIDETLGDGISFETEEDLNKWVGKAKTFIDKPKSLKEYTAEELENELKNPTPSAKGLQALADKIRAETKKKLDDKKEGADKHNELPDELKERLAKIDKLESDFEAAKKEKEESNKVKSFEDLFSKQANGLDDDDKKYVKATLNSDSSEEDIKKAVADYKSMMAKRGFKGFGADSSSKKDLQGKDDDLEKSIKRMLDKKNKK